MSGTPTLSEIVQQATIEFPWNLSIEQSQALMSYIKIKIHGLVEYNFLYSVREGHRDGYEIPLNERVASDWKGTITLSAPPFTSDKFQFKPSEKDNSKLESIQFLIPKDFEGTEYKPEIIQLWDDVGKAIANYFEELED